MITLCFKAIQYRTILLNNKYTKISIVKRVSNQFNAIFKRNHLN